MNEIFSDTISILTLEIFEKYDEDQKVLLKNQLDHLGLESGKAQNLNGPITSIDKMLESWSDSTKKNNGQTIIIFSDSINKKALGFIKYGRKDLFFYQKNGKVVECSPICLLDFYINDIKQRMGIGLTLFQKFIEIVETSPELIAYDRPSFKLISFMRKHYNLINPDIQPNRFAIFKGFPL